MSKEAIVAAYESPELEPSPALEKAAREMWNHWSRSPWETLDRLGKESFCRAFAVGQLSLADNLPLTTDENDWVLPNAVCAYDIARCEEHGQAYPKNAMSATNRQTLAPMVRAAIQQAMRTLAGYSA